MTKKITIKDFVSVIPFDCIADTFRTLLGKREGNKKYKEFLKFMNGQTRAYIG